MRREILVFVALLIAAPLLALLLTLAFLKEPTSALFEIARILLFSEIFSLGLAYLAYRAILRLRLAGIHLKVALGYSLGIGITALNIILISLPMFISAHDANLLIVLLIFAGLLSLAFGYLLARTITRGVEKLTASAEEIAQGNLSARAEVNSGDEVERLAMAFNRMAARLEESFARQQELERSRRELVAAVSHDLRTPLASLRAMLEAITDGVVSDEATTRRYLHAAELQVQSLSLLVDDLFDLSQLDSGVLEMQMEPNSLRDLISDTLESMRVQADAKDVTLSGEVEPDVDLVLMNPHQVQRVLYNLVQNAIRHSQVEGTVAVEARAADNGAEVQVDVTDDGDGIEESDLPYVFDLFYRGEKSRSRETGGAGLGLAIAQRIVQAHHGRIWVTSHRGAGSRVSFTLPRKQKTPH